MERALLLGLAAMVLAAGCVGPAETVAQDDPSSPITPAAASPEGAPETTRAPGTLVVTARYVDATPLAGVDVSVNGTTRVTDGDGSARFDGLDPGPYLVLAAKAAHRSSQVGVDIQSGAETRVDVTLAPEEGSSHAHAAGFEGHRDLLVFDGHFDCHASYVIITGDCLILVENVTGTLGVDDPSKNVTTEKHIIDFPLDLQWSDLVVEMAWTSSAPTFGDAMTLAIEPSEAPADGHAAKYARAHGGSPLRVALEPGVPHATSTANDMPNPQGGEVLRARVFVEGALHNPGGTSFLGVGATRDHAFTLYVSIFYGERAPEGYTAVPGA